MSTPEFRLVTEPTRTPDSFKFEQRREPRHKLYARVTAVAENPEEDRELRSAGQICALELTDQSASGLGAWSIEPVAAVVPLAPGEFGTAGPQYGSPSAPRGVVVTVTRPPNSSPKITSSSPSASKSATSTWVRFPRPAPLVSLACRTPTASV